MRISILLLSVLFLYIAEVAPACSTHGTTAGSEIKVGKGKVSIEATLVPPAAATECVAGIGLGSLTNPLPPDVTVTGMAIVITDRIDGSQTRFPSFSFAPNRLTTAGMAAGAGSTATNNPSVAGATWFGFSSSVQPFSLPPLGPSQVLQLSFDLNVPADLLPLPVEIQFAAGEGLADGTPDFNGPHPVQYFATGETRVVLTASGLSSVSPSSSYVPEVIFGGEWTTTLLIGNLNKVAVTIPLTFWDGVAAQPIAVPIVGVGRVETFTVTVGPDATAVVEIADPEAPSSTLAWGHAEIPCAQTGVCGNVAGHVILKNENPTRPDFESNYQFTSTASRLRMFFDQANSFQTVGVIAYPQQFPVPGGPQPVQIRFHDRGGALITEDRLNMVPGESVLMNFGVSYPETRGRTGMVEVSSSTAGLLFTGIRINPTNAFTPLQSFEP